MFGQESGSRQRPFQHTVASQRMTQHVRGSVFSILKLQASQVFF